MNVIELDQPVSDVLYFVPFIPPLVSSSVNLLPLYIMYGGRISPMALPAAITVEVADLLAVIQTESCLALPNTLGGIWSRVSPVSPTFQMPVGLFSNPAEFNTFSRFS